MYRARLVYIYHSRTRPPPDNRYGMPVQATTRTLHTARCAPSAAAITGQCAGRSITLLVACALVQSLCAVVYPEPRRQKRKGGGRMTSDPLCQFSLYEGRTRNFGVIGSSGGIFSFAGRVRCSGGVTLHEVGGRAVT
ncbi:hypothetical protein BDW22DRAFT_1146153 [Trametopsis cervina]|nr:hypothetical protein BDW22DRAFT_1146153 [Trametopsis cervina]